MLKAIPDSENLHIKEDFEKRYKFLLPKDYDEFMRYSKSFIRRSIRVNTLKIGTKDLIKRLEPKWTLTQVPWCKEGFWIKGERLDIGNLQEHILGYFYVQEAASMIPPEVLLPKSGEIVLDMCAAPGSKTTQIAAMMNNKGVLIANDVSGDRIKALGLNLNRSGVSNTIITHSEGRAIGEIKFDRILVDAPCSATGTIRRNFKTLLHYNYAAIERLSALQKGLIRKAYGMLKSGGTLVYSTCSMEPQEDEEVVSYLLETEENAKVSDIEIDIKRSEPVVEFEGKKYDSSVSKSLRIWPQDNDTEGFFVAKITKDY